MVSLDKNEKIIHTCQLGDSIFYLIRQKTENFELVYQSEEMQKSFNLPYQLGTGGDDYKAAKYKNLNVLNNDIIILVSDGVSDNVESGVILSVLNKNKNLPKEVFYETVSNEIARIAYNNSLNTDYFSPFAKKAIESGRMFFGGKSDDITIIVAQIILHSIS